MSALEQLAQAAVQQARRPQKSQASEIVEMAETVELFRSGSDAYAVIGENRETWKLRSKPFRDYLMRLYWNRYKKAPGAQAVEDALRTLGGKAQFETAERPVHLRIGEHQGRIYLDLCDDAWRAVEITPLGWRVIPNPPIHFTRRRGMLALPEPVHGGGLKLLHDFANVRDDDRVLLDAFMVQALRPRGPYPVLSLQGEQGTAKSTLTRLIRATIDPSTSPLRTLPRDVRDLMIAASNGWMLAFDNVSGVKTWISDALCQLSTGGGLSTRELYSDDEEVLLDATRPVILNGIEDIATRQDLIGRAIVLTLEPIPERARRSESELLAAFEEARPLILGGLLDAVSTAMRRQTEVVIDRKPRMADFAVWATAAEPAFGVPAGRFMQVYAGNIRGAVEMGLDGSPLAHAIKTLLDRDTQWEGAPTELLEALEALVDERTRNSKGWPTSPKGLRNEIRRLASGLRAVGIDVTAGQGRRYRLEKAPIYPSYACHPSHPDGYDGYDGYDAYEPIRSSPGNGEHLDPASVSSEEYDPSRRDCVQERGPEEDVETQPNPAPRRVRI